MKTRIVLAVVLFIGCFAANQLLAQNSPRCTDALIRGAYAFTIDGQKLGGAGPLGPQVGVAMANFDGQGNFTQIDTVTIDGIVVSDFTHSPANGTYTVNSDCTGTFTINFTDGRPPVTANFVVATDGFEIDTVVTSVAGNQGLLATRSIGKRRFEVFPAALVR